MVHNALQCSNVWNNVCVVFVNHYNVSYKHISYITTTVFTILLLLLICIFTLLICIFIHKHPFMDGDTFSLTVPFEWCLQTAIEKSGHL